MEPITLTSERLLLRPFAPGDTDAVHHACQDPEILRWTGIPSPYARADAELFTATLAPAAWRDGSGYQFALVERSGALAGALGLARRSAPGLYEVGFWLAHEYRGQGYCTEAVVRAARWAFSVLGAGRLEWRAEVGNEASRAVALRAGFRLDDGWLTEAVDGGAPRELWTASLFPADLGLPPSGPGRIPSGLGLRLTGPGVPAPGAHPLGSAAYLPGSAAYLPEDTGCVRGAAACPPETGSAACPPEGTGDPPASTGCPPEGTGDPPASTGCPPRPGGPPRERG